MSYVTISFCVFTALTLIAYYLPLLKRFQWLVLLIASLVYYAFTGIPFMIFILAATVITYLGAISLDGILKSRDLEKSRLDKSDKEGRKSLNRKYEREGRGVLVLCLLIVFGILVFMKYCNFTIGLLNTLFSFAHVNAALSPIYMVLPLGLSFYTFQAGGYLIDVYHGKVQAERNFLKTLLFLIFFPQIVQGPISSFEQLHPQLTGKHEFDFINIKFGLELVAWGFFKKSVIADRAAPIVSNITSDYLAYSGTASLFAVLVYALQLYADFSGGIDIIRGIAQMMGIDMTENFRRPYFSVSINDYWTRWHISLGNWMKNYIFYPLAVSKGFDKIRKGIKKSGIGGSSYGKHLSNVMPGCIATVIVFLLIGLWHGAELKYVGFGLYNGFIIMISMLLTPFFAFLNTKLKTASYKLPFRIFQSLRTFVLVAIGYVFDIAPSLSGAFDMMKRSVADFHISYFSENELPILFGEVSAQQMQLNYIILIISTLFLFAVSLVQEITGREIRGILNERPAALQWILLFAGAIFVFTYSIYGPGYDVQGFVYMQF